MFKVVLMGKTEPKNIDTQNALGIVRTDQWKRRDT